MNDERDHPFDAELDRELKGLPELSAPDTLVPRVMAFNRERAAVRMPWYRQSWPTWPLAVRLGSFLVLLAFFGAVCFGGARLFQVEQVATAMQGIGEWFAGWGALLTALKALGEAVVRVAGRLGPAFIFASATVVALSYFMCIGVGTAFVRFAFIRKH